MVSEVGRPGKKTVISEKVTAVAFYTAKSVLSREKEKEEKKKMGGKKKI